MSLAESLAALSRGDRPAADGLLGNCRLEWAGGEAYGEEAIRESFLRDPIDVTAGVIVTGSTGAAWIGAADAIFADVHEGRLVRLWRLGDGTGADVEPAVAVAFDPDMTQARGDVHARLADHPQLAPDALAAVRAAGGQALALADQVPLHRARAFLVRAFTVEGVTVALFAVHRLSSGPVRTSGFAHALALISEDVRIIHDRVSPRDWTPRL